MRRAAGGVLGGIALGFRALTTPVAAQEADRAAPTLPAVTVTAPARVAASSEVLIPDRDFQLRPQGGLRTSSDLCPGS